MELYDSDLRVLGKLLEYVDIISTEHLLYELEIRVRLDEGQGWVVLGYGEAGDPCVLRFEEDPKPVLVKQPLSVTTINPNPFNLEPRLA